MKSNHEDEEYDEEPQVYPESTPEFDTKRRYFIGKDYSNPYEKDFETLDKFSEGNSLFLSAIDLIYFSRLHRSKNRSSYAMAR